MGKNKKTGTSTEVIVRSYLREQCARANKALGSVRARLNGGKLSDSHSKAVQGRIAQLELLKGSCEWLLGEGGAVETRSKAPPNRAYLTDSKVASLRSKQKDYFVWDAGGRRSVPGLHLHVQSSGTRTFRCSVRFKGAKNATSYKLGRWPDMSLAEAREKASLAAKLVLRGIDPRVMELGAVQAAVDAFGIELKSRVVK